MKEAQQELFPEPATCKACGATSKDDCAYEPVLREPDYRRRPKGCLAATDPSKTEVPY